MAYGPASDKILHNKAFNIAENPKYDGYQRSLASMVRVASLRLHGQRLYLR